MTAGSPVRRLEVAPPGGFYLPLPCAGRRPGRGVRGLECAAAGRLPAPGWDWPADDRYYRSVTMMTSDTQLRRVELAPAVALFRSLADPARLAIVRRLAAGEARVVDLVGEIGLAQATVSAHLACLRDCGLVASPPAARPSPFPLPHPHPPD